MSDPVYIEEDPVSVEIPKLIVLEGFLPKFKMGAIVKLKSGSPRLTVTAEHHGHVEVQWFEGTEAKQKIYPVAALQAVPRRRKVHV